MLGWTVFDGLLVLSAMILVGGKGGLFGMLMTLGLILVSGPLYLTSKRHEALRLAERVATAAQSESDIAWTIDGHAIEGRRGAELVHELHAKPSRADIDAAFPAARLLAARRHDED